MYLIPLTKTCSDKRSNHLDKVHFLNHVNMNSLSKDEALLQ